MSQLTARPNPFSRATTSAEFHADASVWVSTPVRPSQRTEFIDKLDYAFAYGEELAKLLRTHGFKSSVGLTLDGPDAESDFAVLLANMAHVFGPRLRFHVEGIGDPDAHRFWVRLRAVILDETIDPAPQLAAFRTLVEKHRKLHPSYTDVNLVQDLYSVLRAYATVSPYVTPLYLVVLRELGSNTPFTYATLALRVSKIFRDESPLARLSAPSPPASGGGGRGSAGGGGGRGSAGGGKATVGSVYAAGWKKLVPPNGEWKPVKNARYLQWEGTGIVCVTCFRLWAVTTVHLDTDGVCPFSCAASFAPGRAPAGAPTAVAPPPMSAWPPAPPPAARAASLQALEPPPLADAAQTEAAAMSIRLHAGEFHCDDDTQSRWMRRHLLSFPLPMRTTPGRRSAPPQPGYRHSTAGPPLLCRSLLGLYK
ncbi:hypothetical protein CYMTET_10565 [Cymbomonas tetramitiformis]|uniref:Uncharacterized protein n=1 Tax=Cymbomonas tetramitiformis TaxID=36881 RepID=A0AAE0GNY1_9CHLO|nr:hypothetical protein CYMTET_10565 [Cymbomonas tetramitiformis]